MATGWGVSEADVEYYKNEFNAKGIEFLPVFLPGDQVKSLAGQGSFCLYHGNLSVNENERAAEWLLKEVFSKTSIPFVMAGKNPSTYLQHLAHVHPHTCIVANPSEHEMQDLIKKAQINILPSFNQTGVKLKLLNALFNGRHCIVNTATVEGSGLEGLCHIATDAHAFISNIEELFQVPYTNEDINQRAQHLQSVYNNEQNGRKLISWIY